MSSNRKRTKKKRTRCALLVSGTAVFILLCCGLVAYFWQKNQEAEKAARQKNLPKLSIETKLLDVNPYSRPGIALKKVKGVVVHYTANPGTNALDNRNYFNGLSKANKGKTKAQSTYASSHFIVGLQGQIVQCVPLNEIAYASNNRNADTISIECCHPDQSGKFTEATYKSVVELVAYLCLKYDLSEGDVIRHYDVTGKNCPKYFVENPKEWTKFKSDVKNKMGLS